MNPLRIIAILCLLASVMGADGQTAHPQDFTHRITGLFSPDRAADLRAAMERIPEVQLVRLDFTNAIAILRYDPAVAFQGTKPEKIVERLNDALRNASRHTLGVAPVDPAARDKLTRVEIAVAGLDCKACCLAAYESIFKIDGVTAATASFKDGRVTALIDPERTSRASLEEALKKRGVALVKLPHGGGAE